MRILLDESLPQRLRFEFGDHEVKTVAWMGWSGVKNGQLLELAAPLFEVFITADQNLEHQQNLNAFPIIVIILATPNNQRKTLQALVPDILEALRSTPVKTLIHIPKKLLQAKFKDISLLVNIQKATLDKTHLHLWWLGQSGFLLQFQGKHLLLDPYLSDSLTKKYAASHKPHVRMTELVIAPEKLDFIDLVTSSHNHTDHLDAETLIPLMQVNPNLKLIVSKANLEFAAQRLQVAPERLTPITQGEAIRLEPFTFHAVPAAHEHLDTDDDGNHKFIGLIIEVGAYTIYHSGDTLLYDGIVAILKQWQIDVALLPINGRDPKRGVAGNLSGIEAANLAKDIGAKLVIPCHYDMFEFNTASPDEFVGEAKSLGQAYRVLQHGEGISL